MTKQPLTRDIAEVMESLHRTLEARKEAATPEPPQSTPEPQARVVHLPLWPEPTRGTPNSFLRGALFAAIQGKERQGLQRQVLASQKGSTIRFTGIQLDQSDLDVWEQATQLARPHPLGNVCHFHIHAFLKALRRDTGKSQHEWLKGAFARLAGCCVEITEGRYTYGGAMLEFRRDEVAGVYIVRLNPTILNLYNAGWTAIDWDIRHKLRRKPLALWLHGWLSSNAKNYPVKVETLHRLSGSTNPHKGSFKRQLRKALEDLKNTGAITAVAITSDLVTIERKPSHAQLRHLSKKARRKPRKNGEK
jgi:TrfA protein